MKNQQAATVLRDLSPARIFARPTADDVWLGPAQESALSQLNHSLPLRVLLGPGSSGRTTLIRILTARSDQALTLNIGGPQRLRETVLKGLLTSAGLPTDGLEIDEMRRVLGLFLLENRAKGQRVVIAIDDADDFGPGAFSEIARLVGASHSGRPGPEVLMSLVHTDTHSSPAADFIRAQDAPALTVMSWLSDVDVSRYLQWRLDRFDLSNLFTNSAVRLVARCTKGCFASIDHLCQVALLLLRNRTGNQVDVMLIREAVRVLERRIRETGQSNPSAGELIISRDAKLIKRVPLRDRVMIGRSQLNDICLESSYLSRHHLSIVRGNSGFYLSDLNSVNGVSLNGQRVRTAPIGDGDVISLGPFRVKLVTTPPMWPNTPGTPDLADLADTVVMPLPSETEPGHLKVIK